MTNEFIPNKGIKLTQNNISLISLMETRIKKGFDMPLPSTFATRILQLIRALAHETEQPPIVIDPQSQPFSQQDFIPYNQKYIYKYIPPAYLSYYQKGKILLGTIDNYQTIENAKIRDEFEGYSMLRIKTTDQEVYCGIIGGYNHYIFCATHNNNTDEIQPSMQGTFGDTLLKIELEPFAEKIRKRLRAKSYNVHLVKYANAKLFETDTFEIKLGDGVSFIPSLFQPLAQISFLPCLFIKPQAFHVENEVRITFELPYDVKIPKTFEHTGLCRYIKVVNN